MILCPIHLALFILNLNSFPFFASSSPPSLYSVIGKDGGGDSQLETRMAPNDAAGLPQCPELRVK